MRLRTPFKFGAVSRPQASAGLRTLSARSSTPSFLYSAAMGEASQTKHFSSMRAGAVASLAAVIVLYLT